MHRQAKLWRRALQSAQLMLLTMALTLFLFHLSGCQPQETELPFVTIDQDNGIGWGAYKGEKPKLVVLTGPEEVAVLDEVISQPSEVVFEDTGETWQYHEWRLRDMDWEAYFVVIAFQGLNGDGVTIKRITQQGQRITVQAQFKQLGPGETGPGITSPLHVVKAEKNNQMVGQEFQFSLVVDGTTVANTSHFVP
jgi:hypothetical protein